MKLYLLFNIQNPQQLLMQQELLQELKSLGLTLISNIDAKKVYSDEMSFESLDALIIDGSSSEAEAGYMLAIALAHKKPVLYLLPKGSLIDVSVDTLSKNAEMKKLIKIVFYTPETLVKKVKSYLQFLDVNIGKESFTIKYTLRLSPRIDRYLAWKAEKTKKNKANFLRDFLNTSLDEDEKYKSRLD